MIEIDVSVTVEVPTGDKCQGPGWAAKDYSVCDFLLKEEYCCLFRERCRGSKVKACLAALRRAEEGEEGENEDSIESNDDAPATHPAETVKQVIPDEGVIAHIGPGDLVGFSGLDWRVLEIKDGNALLLSEHVLDRGYSFRGINAYLNGEFFNSLDSDVSKHIVETKLETLSNPWFGTKGDPAEDTVDKVFLLSLEEVVKYFGDSGQLDKRPSGNTYAIDDQYNKARMTQDLDGDNSWWWLRSPGIDGSGAARVNADGVVHIFGDLSNNIDGGVRPALWVKLEALGH